MRNGQLLAGLIVLVLVLAACAAGANPQVGVPSGGGQVAGFWLGLWHGIISPITFLISLFSKTVSIYEVHTTATGTTSASCWEPGSSSAAASWAWGVRGRTRTGDD